MNLTKSDYSKFARAAVTDFIDNDIPLKESVQKLAQEHSLNSDQTRRLVEQTNTLAHLNLFEKEANDDGKYIEFETINPDDIVKEAFTVEKTASVQEHYTDLTDFYSALPNERNAMTKEASFHDLDVQQVLRETSPNTQPYSRARGYQKIARVQRVHEELYSRTQEEYEEYTSAMEDIAHDLNRMTKEAHVQFEKDVLSLHKEEAPMLLAKLAALTHGRFEPKNVEAEQRLVIVHPIHAKVASAVEHRNNAITYGTTYNKMSQDIKALK